MLIHPFSPIFDSNSSLLVLGSFPSVKSREHSFYYGHPQNRFWHVIALICNASVPNTIEEKTTLLLKNHIALWDVIASCEVLGSSDSSIRNVIPNDLSEIFQTADIQNVYCNGSKAWGLYQRYSASKYHKDAVRLPSTSPANAAWTLDKLTAVWSSALCGNIFAEQTGFADGKRFCSN